MNYVKNYMFCETIKLADKVGAIWPYSFKLLFLPKKGAVNLLGLE